MSQNNNPSNSANNQKPGQSGGEWSGLPSYNQHSQQASGSLMNNSSMVGSQVPNSTSNQIKNNKLLVPAGLPHEYENNHIHHEKLDKKNSRVRTWTRFICHCGEKSSGPSSSSSWSPPLISATSQVIQIGLGGQSHDQSMFICDQKIQNYCIQYSIGLINTSFVLYLYRSLSLCSKV